MLFRSKWLLYFVALLLSSVSKTSAMHGFVIAAKSLPGTTSTISLSFTSDFPCEMTFILIFLGVKSIIDVKIAQ